MINYKKTLPDINSIISLYIDAEWLHYLSDKEKLHRAYVNSQDVYSAWDKNKLVGIIRTIGDGETIVYIQDIIVLKEYQRMGIGSKLLSQILDKHYNIRQIVLITDNTVSTNSFYNSIGLSLASKYNINCFLKINNL